MNSKRKVGFAVMGAVLAASIAGCADLRATRSLELYEERDFVTSLHQSRLALERDQDNQPALAMAGWSSFQMGRYIPAQRYFRHLLYLNPDSFDALLGMGWTQLKLGHVEVARQYFTQSGNNVELPWQRRFVWDALGWVALKKGNKSEARKLFQNELKSIDYAPLMADANVGLGWIALLDKKLDEAQKAFTSGIELNPDCFNCFDGLARVEFEKGNYGQALGYTLTGISRVRHSINLVTLLAAILEKIGDPRRSLEVYDKLVARYPKAAFFRVGKADALLALGRGPEAERSLVQALQSDPDYPGLKSRLEDVRRSSTNRQPSGPAVNAGPAAEVTGSHIKLHLSLVGPLKPSLARSSDTTAPNAGELEIPEAAPMLSDAVYRFIPGSRGSMFENAIISDQQPAPLGVMLVSLSIYNKGWSLLDAGRLDEAERAFETAALTMPEHLRYLMHDALGWVAFYRRDYDKAGEIFTNVLVERPDSYLSRKGLGFVYLAQGRYSDGAKLIEDSLQQNPYQIPLSYILPGEQLLAAGKYGEAQRILEIGAWAHPRVAKISFLLARSFAGLGRVDEAVEQLEAAAALDPVEVESLFDTMSLPVEKALPAIRSLAWGLLLAGDYKGARRRFDQLLSVVGNNPEAMRGRGFALFRLGKYSEAIADLSEAARHEPDGLPAISQELPIPGTGKHAQVTYNAGSVLAWTYLKMGNAARAELEFRKTLKQHPSWLDALCGLGYSQLAQNDPQGALRSFEAALKVSPHYPDALNGINSAKAVLDGKKASNKPAKTGTVLK